MGDIKITLSRALKYAADIDKEIEFLKREGSLWYPLTARGKPTNVFSGDEIYFILKGNLAGRATIDNIEPPQSEMLNTYNNGKISKNSWGVRIHKIEKPRKSLLVKGFQSFRYLTPTECQTFPKAFS